MVIGRKGLDRAAILAMVMGRQCTSSPPSRARIDDGSDAVDLGQEPGDVVVLSAADSELACLAAAYGGSGPAFSPAVGQSDCASAIRMSVDLYVEKVIARARLVVVRLLGGRSYWPYGLEQVARACRRRRHSAGRAARRRSPGCRPGR